MRYNSFGRLTVWVILSIALLFGFNSVSFAQSERSPLQPLDTSSPRATLTSFVAELEEAYRLGTEGLPGSQEKLENAVEFLDLSEVPPGVPLSAKVEMALWLKEVLDRIDLPEDEEIPGLVDDMPDRWRIPNTPITIHRLMGGDRDGAYLFTPETVERAETMYKRVEALPYRGDATPGIYLAYSTTPGQGLDVGFTRMLPDWSKRTLAGQTYWQWIAVVIAVLVVAASYLPATLYLRSVRHDSETRSVAQGVLLSLAILFAYCSCWLVADTLDERVNVTGDSLTVVLILLSIAAYLTLAWLAIVAVPTLSGVLRQLWGISPADSRGLLLRLAEWVITILLIGVLFVQFAHEQGWPAYSIVTGLGVGGIAIGFGAQSLVRDIISGVFFLMDDAFREGEYVNVGVAKGTVEKISI